MNRDSVLTKEAQQRPLALTSVARKARSVCDSETQVLARLQHHLHPGLPGIQNQGE